MGEMKDEKTKAKRKLTLTEKRLKKAKEQGRAEGKQEVYEELAKVGAAISKYREKQEAEAEALRKKEEEAKMKRATIKATRDEAEGATLPKIDEQITRITPYSKEEILKSGSLRDKFKLYFIDRDMANYFDNDERLSEREITILKHSVRTDEDEKAVRQFFNEYRVLSIYTQRVRFFFKRFQTSFSFLAKYVNLLDSYRRTAEGLTDTYKIMELALEREPNKEKHLQTLRAAMIGKANFEGAELRYSEEDKCFYVWDGPRKGLRSKIREAAKDTKMTLSDFKACALVAEEYILESTLQYMPLAMQMCIENAEEERYTRYLVENLRFFRSELNDKEAEQPRLFTFADDRVADAVIPDYFEVKPSRRIYTDCKRGINKL